MVSKLSQICSNEWNYELIPDDHDASSDDLVDKSSRCTRQFAIWIFWAGSIVFTGILSMSAILTISSWSRDPQVASCRNPAIRREWRALTADERKNFIDAVNCLSREPARWGPNGTVYDDFSLLHERIGSLSHGSASFLPWHRYFLKAWESALKEHCDFKGQVPYWDWTTDWMDLAASSIWNNETGFGGDGEPESPLVVGGGRCVTDGPFSHLHPIRYNRTYVDHCLARGFKTTDTSGRPLGPWFGPESIGKLMRSPSYREFEWEMENRLHNRIHRAVSGDFLAFAAGNDPVFYLHHAQIDNLWWKWQQEDAKTRLYQYEGEHQRDSTGNATLSDILQFGGFIEDVPVSHVMDTQNKFLCYRY
ncbi:Tyrosinase ustQ [Colletotrichum fructicola]|uniref:Tyrosinase ustQ n=2 Tax=Colletotrichum fructicola (strain Nara gc5) TaxID=1213859 RepID=A0A7J6JBY0_COLFN|nr:Tyrosinase ustQ [Colletotrichum fructicola Nara gc5]KAF4885906.1 Tyrosinase ustQ [Colletotrichum fructicola]KAF4887128.1 Tyrosinase ustQ [Colletotrichum fructicola]KAF4925635.1 Tyrosinase ustQ [Colletotrichum fructicola]